MKRSTRRPSPLEASASRSRPEILAPAGSRESLIAALASGADAVYLGLDEGFNARARAANFSLDNLAETVAMTHAAGARVYVTLNTLLFEPELKRVEEILRAIARAKVDAIILQDPAVALISRDATPAMELHGSTQMTISTGSAARFADQLGITRVVVPRELSIYEIRDFAASTSLELEVFIHGALCVSWSGQCLTSEAWSGRSANRGQCAQSCRLPYSLLVDDEERDLGDVRYLLSPKDLAGARALPSLIELGVSGLKIEGRQKGPQYVSTSVHGYRGFVDRATDQAITREENEQKLRDDLLDMTLSYSRGFSDGFFAGSDHQVLVEGRFPKHRGVYLGRVTAVGRDHVDVESETTRPWTGGRAADVPVIAPLGEVSSPLAPFGSDPVAGVGPRARAIDVKNGMGVVFDAGDPERKDEPGGPIFDVSSNLHGWRLRFGRPGPDLRKVNRGDRVWVTQDPAVTKRVERDLKSGAPTGKIPLDLVVSGTLGGPLQVVARWDHGEVSAVGETSLEESRGTGLDADLVREKIGALGGTAFYLRHLDTSSLAARLHAPVSELKQLRRQIVERLDAQRLLPNDVPDGSVLDDLRARLAATVSAQTSNDRRLSTEPRIVPLCRTDAQLEAAIQAQVTEVELDWMELVGLKRATERARAAGLRVTLATLRIQKPGEEDYLGAIRKLSPDAILVRHVAGMVELTQDETTPVLHGDFSLNVTNSLTALHLLARPLDTVTAAFDLDEDQLHALLDHVPPHRVAVVIHHRVPAFHTEHCVYAHLLSAGRDYRTCGRPCDSHQVSLKDDQRRVHPVIVDAGCRNTVFNADLQSGAELVPRLVARGVTRFRVEFVRETEAEALTAIETYGRLIAGEISPKDALSRVRAKGRFGLSDRRMQLLGDAN